MTTGQKVAVLIDALNNGSILYKEYEYDEKQFIFKSGSSYEIRGWCSALDNFQQVLFEITQKPDKWKIFPNFNMNVDEHPFPWSTIGKK